MKIIYRIHQKASIPTMIIILGMLVLTSCMQNAARRGRVTTENATSAGSSGDDSNGLGSVNDSDGNVGVGDDVSLKVDIRHLVDPFDGTFKTKLTIPKNLSGLLYISGLNFTSLSDRLISARFNFGREKEPITIPGTINRAAGLTPQTDIQVLILDMDDKPFNRVRLLYDLFDYNTYDEATGTPTTDPRDNKLYCRGLKLEYDPTFEPSVGNPDCDAVGERCLYAYAKILDSGLQASSNLYLIPTEPQVDTGTTGYSGITAQSSEVLKRCLPDNDSEDNFEGVTGKDLGIASMDWGTAVTIGSAYTYRGPFRSLGYSIWEITGAAIYSRLTTSCTTGTVTTSPTGLFECQLASATSDTPLGGYRSFLFPRAGKMELRSEVEHFSSDGGPDPGYPFAERGLVGGGLATSGETDYMDGCNIRVINYDSNRNEGINSCNVTATIEILAKDPETGYETVVATSTDLKLQITRPSRTNSEGKEVMYSAMKSCSSSRTCAHDECCYNRRCWSKDIVSQCIEDVTTVGNQGIGTTCISDYECSSLCCRSGICSVHVYNSQQEVLCSKPLGDYCVAEEWCSQIYMEKCTIVRTGSGPTDCMLQCLQVPYFGRCKNGVCASPATPAEPEFDENDPNRCSGV